VQQKARAVGVHRKGKADEESDISSCNAFIMNQIYLYFGSAAKKMQLICTWQVLKKAAEDAGMHRGGRL
jgi:hypothetical protein